MSDKKISPRIDGDPYYADLAAQKTYNLAGNLHTKLSRQHKRYKADAWRNEALRAANDRDALAAAKQVDKYRCQLAVRKGFAVITAPLDAIAGTSRGRARFLASDALPGKARRKEQGKLSRQQLSVHPADGGAVGYAATGLLLAGVGVGGAVGGVVGGVTGLATGVLFRAKRALPTGVALGAAGGVALGAIVVGVPCGILTSVAGLPGAGVKALADGIGSAAGAVYAPLHAHKTLKSLKKDGFKAEPERPDDARVGLGLNK